MKITAIIPLFNGEKYIQSSLLSLYNQSSKIDEIIIINDSSTDGSLQTIQKFKKERSIPLKIVSNNTNRGSSYSRNIGIKKSTYEYVLFLDQDDYLDKNFIFEIRNHLENFQNHSIDAIHTSYIIIDENGNNHGKVNYDNHPVNEFLGYQFVRNRILSNSGTLVRKSILSKSGLFDESLNFSQDWDLWLRIGRFGNFSFLNKHLTYIRRHPNNTSCKLKNFLDDEKKILKKHDLKFIEDSIFARSISTEENEEDFLSILYRLDEFKLCEERAELVLTSYPMLENIMFFKGLLEIRKGNYEKGTQFFNKISTYSKFYLPAQNNLSICYATQTKFSQSLHILEKVIAEKNNYNDALKNLGLIKLKKTDFKKYQISARPLRDILYEYI